MSEERAMSFSVRLQKLAMESGLSRGELASRSEMSYTHFCKVLYGEVIPGPTPTGRIAEALGMTVDELLTGVCEADAGICRGAEWRNKRRREREKAAKEKLRQMSYNCAGNHKPGRKRKGEKEYLISYGNRETGMTGFLVVKAVTPQEVRELFFDGERHDPEREFIGSIYVRIQEE